jgi:hypothetical protein
MEIGARTERDATKNIAAWRASGVLTKGTYYQTNSRHEVAKVALDEAGASSWHAAIAATGEGDIDATDRIKIPRII